MIKELPKITVVDSIMGSGKTSMGIQMINADSTKKHIYITPYLREVDRIKENCKQHKFVDPINKGKGKLHSFEQLIKDERNIVATHSLFRGTTDEIMELIRLGEYTLILDEVMDVVEQYPMKKDDIKNLLNLNLIEIHDDGLITWNEDKMDNESKYDDIKLLCKNNSLFMVNNAILMWTFPIEVFKSFKEIYILTYLFDGQIQRYYYDLYNIDYEYKSVARDGDKFNLIDYQPNQQVDMGIKSLITIIDNDDKLNRIGDDKHALSKSWFEKNELLLEILRKNMVTYFKLRYKCKSADRMWSTYKDSRNSIKDSCFNKGFISLGTRATNDYINKQALAFCANIFLNPIVSNFFHAKGVKVDEDTYALSELLQWIWRSRIRDGKEICLYIPSARMRGLLIEWMNCEKE